MILVTRRNNGAGSSNRETVCRNVTKSVIAIYASKLGVCSTVWKSPEKRGTMTRIE